MNRRTLGYVLLGGAVAVWLFSYYQQSQAITSGQIMPDQALNLSDRIFSPAGVAAVAGGYLIYTSR